MTLTHWSAGRLCRFAILLLSAGLTACGVPGPSPRADPVPVLSAHDETPAAASAPLPGREPEFAWPAKGAVVGRFDGQANRGVDIAGKPGDAVVAARDGRVVLVSNALATYGTMIVLMHDEALLTAYAHLDKTHVKEGETVRKGQRIADMGHSAAGDMELHFEIRERGVPVDPLPYLRARSH